MVLYLSYDGMFEPLGQSQVLEYLEGLSNHHNYHFVLISFEKKGDLLPGRVEELRATLAKKNIIWHPLTYHKRPTLFATGFDILWGFTWAFFLTKQHSVKIVHSRSYVSAMIGLLLKKTMGIRFVFDMRGFWADEKVDTGQWVKGSLIYRLTKKLEAAFLRNADHVVSLTRRAIGEILSFKNTGQLSRDKISVIPTCANLQLFQKKPDAQDKIDPNMFVLGYVGGAKLWYDFDAAINLFKSIQSKTPSAKFNILNKNEHDYIQQKLKEHRISEQDYQLQSLNREATAAEMGKFNAAVFFIQPFYSKMASAPTKMAEILARGVPCVTNDIGDLAHYVMDFDVGVIVNEFSLPELERAAQLIIDKTHDQNIANRCRQLAEKSFSLENGVNEYASIYAKLLAHNE